MTGDAVEARPRRRVRALAGVVALLLCVAAVGYYLSADSFAEVHARAAQQAAAGDGVQGGTGDPGPPQMPGDPVPGAPVTSGPGFTKPGITLQVSTGPDDSLDVAETVRLRRPVDSIRLRAPEVDRAGGDLGQATATATSVQLSVNGQPVRIPEELGAEGTVVYLPTGASSYAVRYLLEGVTVRSSPSSSGRALGAVGPLSQAGPAGRVMVYASGESILNLSCPLLDGNAAACGTPTDTGIRLARPLPGRSALVVVQLDLPEP